MHIGKTGQIEVRAADVDRLLEAAREVIAQCQKQADVLQFLADEVAGREIIIRMQSEAHLLSQIGAVAPDRRREAERLMGECAKIWTGIATAKPWAWR